MTVAAIASTIPTVAFNKRATGSMTRPIHNIIRKMTNETNGPRLYLLSSHNCWNSAEWFFFIMIARSMGETLKELNFRQKCNVNIVTIIRGEQRINIPGGEERLYPFDKLVVVGADVDLEHFRQYLVERYKKAQTDKEQTTHEVNMEQFTIAEGSHLIGRTILESGIRDRSACLVIGIERGSSSIKNPSPSTVFEEGDIVWIVGEHEKVVQLSEGKTVNN